MSAYLDWFNLGHKARRCLACGSPMLQSDPDHTAWMCPARYMSPHTEKYMSLVAEELDQMGAICEGDNPTREEHQRAIDKARVRYGNAAAWI